MTASDLFARLSAALAQDYELIRPLGQGGMAAVFLAREKALKRPVAIKVLLPDLAGPAFRARFAREAETAAQLQHPNIVPIFRVGEADGLAYYSMGYVEGESLADRLAREERLGLAEASRIGAEVAAALGAAHRRGIIHRDVKPQNIMIEAESGRALVTDFGIASVAAGGDDDERLTGLGMVMGTPRYMSPEQAAGERDLTPAADMYSLGLVLYEMLTGKYPYRDARGPKAMVAHLSQAGTPVRTHDESIPAPVGEAVDALLDKDPSRRPGPAELRVALGDRIHADSGSGSTPRSPARRRPSVALLAGVAVVILAIIGATVWASAGGPPRGVDPRKSLLIGFFDNTSADPALDWLRLGGVDLMTQSLRRWQDLQVVEADRLLDLARRAGVEEGNRLSRDQALAMARAAGVWTATVGTLVPADGRIRVSLNVYDVASERQLTQASALVDRETIAAAFDSLATQVLNLADVPRAALIDVDPPTRSLEAYRAYVEGIGARSRWELDSASAAFRRAIELDSAFALAYYELSQSVFVKEFLSPDPTYIALSDAALRFAQARPARERLLIEAYNALVHSDLPRSRDLYQQLIRLDSTIADAWSGLGIAAQLDLTLRTSPQGREYLPADLTLARRGYERALALDGSDHRVYLNLANVLAMAGQEEERVLPTFRDRPTVPIHLVTNRLPVRFYGILLVGDSLLTIPSDSIPLRFTAVELDSLRRRARGQAREVLRQWIRLAPDEGQAHLLKAGLDHLDEDYDAALASLSTAERLRAEGVVSFPVQRLALLLMARRLESAARLGDSLDTGEPFPGNTVLAQVPVLVSHYVAGRIGRARELVRDYMVAASRMSPDSQVRQVLDLVGGLTPVRERAAVGLATRQEVADALRIVERSRVAAAAGGTMATMHGRGVGWIIFAAATTGDTATVRRLVGDGKRPSARALAAAIAGDRAEAARHYLESTGEGGPDSPSRRFALAVTAERLGRMAEAARHYSAMDTLEYDVDGPDTDWLLLVRSYAMRAAVYEALGDPALARENYRKFIILWSGADPELQAEVGRARSALGGLERVDRGDAVRSEK